MSLTHVHDLSWWKRQKKQLQYLQLQRRFHVMERGHCLLVWSCDLLWYHQTNPVLAPWNALFVDFLCGSLWPMQVVRPSFLQKLVKLTPWRPNFSLLNKKRCFVAHIHIHLIEITNWWTYIPNSSAKASRSLSLSISVSRKKMLKHIILITLSMAWTYPVYHISSLCTLVAPGKAPYPAASSSGKPARLETTFGRILQSSELYLNTPGFAWPRNIPPKQGNSSTLN